MASDQPIQRIYTDGACSGNPGPGGWGTVVYYGDGSVHELGGAESQTTNNRMEMQAAIGALEFLLESGETASVTLYTDSEYVKNGITKWIAGWKKKSWKTSAGKPVLNQDLWQILDDLKHRVADQLPLQWQYVRGHSGNEGNERCDEIARAYSLGRTPQLRRRSPAPSSSPVSKAAAKPAPDVDLPVTSDTLVTNAAFATAATVTHGSEAIQSRHTMATPALSDAAMQDPNISLPADGQDLPREVRVAHLRNMVETLHMADEVASRGYLITSAELADLMDVNASAVTSRGDNWVWRNWVVSRVRREGNQILWQLERVD